MEETEELTVIDHYENMISEHAMICACKQKKLNSKIKRLTDSNAYDFQMTSEKFSNHYNYKFTDDLEIIVDNIINFYKNR